MRNIPLRRLLAGRLTLTLAFLAASATARVRGEGRAEDGFGPVPLQEAHAHNDYEHERPLLDALDHGFCSVEADVWLVDGALLVAHDLKDVKADRTLESLYLEPLRARVAENEGTVYKRRPGERVPEFVLLIDVKSAADPAFEKIRASLDGHREMLTEFGTTSVERRAVTVVISGNRAIGRIIEGPKRLAGYDGRLPDLESGASTLWMPIVSDNWVKYFKWRGEGEFPEEERARLADLAARVHKQGKRIRFWGAPDKIEAWRELHAAGVDMINTDDLEGLQKFLTGLVGR